MNHFALLMDFLRDRQSFLQDVSKQIRLDHKIVSLLITSSAFLALYGGIIGSGKYWQQVIVSAIKLPALYLLTLLICLPTLFFFDVISGSRRSFKQYLTLLLAATASISIMLFAFAPVILFFRLSINDYLFFKLVNVVVFVLTGLIGIQFFYRGMQYLVDEGERNNPQRLLVMRGWLVLYGFVGSQLGWSLRPFFGSPNDPFALFRQQDSNFYFHIFKVILELLGFGS